MMRQALGIFVSLVLVGCGDERPDKGEGGAAGMAASGNNQGGGPAAGSGGSKQAGGNDSGGKGAMAAGGSAASGSSSGGSAGGAPVARGAISLNLLAPAGCSLSSRYEEFPSMASGHAVSATDKGPGIRDGEASDGGPANVFCRRTGNNPPYKIVASISTGFLDTARGINFTTGTAVGTATAASVVVQLPVDQNYMGECMFTPIEVDETAHSIWGGFSCESFVPFEGQDPCAIGESYFFFENCE